MRCFYGSAPLYLPPEFNQFRHVAILDLHSLCRLFSVRNTTTVCSLAFLHQFAQQMTFLYFTDENHSICSPNYLFYWPCNPFTDMTSWLKKYFDFSRSYGKLKISQNPSCITKVNNSFVFIYNGYQRPGFFSRWLFKMKRNSRKL